MRQQEVRGSVKKAKGKVKEAVGILSGNKKMEQEGSLQRAQGAIQETFSRAYDKVGKVFTDIGKAISK
ncbi:MAG: CsbD family protein [Thermoanaerobaculia bacterium]